MGFNIGVKKVYDMPPLVRLGIYTLCLLERLAMIRDEFYPHLVFPMLYLILTREISLSNVLIYICVRSFLFPTLYNLLQKTC